MVDALGGLVGVRAQRAMVGARLKEIFAAEAKKRQQASGGDKKSEAARSVPKNFTEPISRGDARDKAAEAVNVSGPLIDAWREAEANKRKLASLNRGDKAPVPKNFTERGDSRDKAAEAVNVSGPLIQAEAAERRMATQFAKGKSPNPGGKPKAEAETKTSPPEKDTKAKDSRSTIGQIAKKAAFVDAWRGAEAKEAKERQRKHGGTAPGKTKTLVETFPQVNPAHTCTVCGEQFSTPVWHCEKCNHHWPEGRDSCGQCSSTGKTRDLLGQKVGLQSPTPWRMLPAPNQSTIYPGSVLENPLARPLVSVRKQ